VDICSPLELCLSINSNPHVIHNILITDKAHFTRDGVNNTRNSHLWDRDNRHGTVESNYQHRFSVSVWCGVIGDQMIGPYIFPQRVTGDIYASVLQDELPALFENVPLQTRRQMYYQHNGPPPHFSKAVSESQIPKSIDWSWRCTELVTTVTKSEPIRLSCVVYMKATVYARKVNTTEELLQEFSALQEASTTLQCFVRLQVL